MTTSNTDAHRHGSLHRKPWQSTNTDRAYQSGGQVGPLIRLLSERAGHSGHVKPPKYGHFQTGQVIPVKWPDYDDSHVKVLIQAPYDRVAHSGNLAGSPKYSHPGMGQGTGTGMVEYKTTATTTTIKIRQVSLQWRPCWTTNTDTCRPLWGTIISHWSIFKKTCRGRADIVLHFTYMYVGIGRCYQCELLNHCILSLGYQWCVLIWYELNLLKESSKNLRVVPWVFLWVTTRNTCIVPRVVNTTS